VGTVNGHCPDGRPHHWLLSDPEYVRQDGKYMELTHQTCLNCDVKRDNLCPMGPEAWVDSLVIEPMHKARVTVEIEE